MTSLIELEKKKGLKFQITFHYSHHFIISLKSFINYLLLY